MTTYTNEFTPKIHEKLQKLNAKLIVVEKTLLASIIRLDTTLQHELNDNIDDLVGCALQVDIQCYNDVENAEPLCILDEEVSRLSIQKIRDKRFYVGDDHNHNTFPNTFPQEHLCWLFHCLYEHTDLSAKEIASITNLFVEIKSMRQYDFTLA